MPFSDYILDAGCFVVSSGISFTLYMFLKAGEEVVEALKLVPELTASSHLINQVSESSEQGLLACVRGTVRAVESPLKCIARPDITGVVSKHTIKEHVVAQIMGLWMNDDRIVESSSLSVPFLLMNKGIGIHISDPNKLEEIDLKIVSEKFEPAHNTLADHLWGWMKGVRSTGIEETEEMLMEGTEAVGIGRLIIKDDSLHLESAPVLPYIVTTKDKKSLIQAWTSPLPILRILSFIGFCMASFHAYRIIKRFWQRRKKQQRQNEDLRRIIEARAQREANERDLPESLMCVICCGLRDVLLIPCQHVCVCGECSLKLDPRICPVCRTPIEVIRPVFFS